MNTKVFGMCELLWFFSHVVTEANMCGCNIVASENVGRLKLIAPKLLLKILGMWRVLEKIELAINNKFTPFANWPDQDIERVNVMLFGQQWW